MNTYTKLKPLTKLAAVTAATLTATSLINCGGGGAATDNMTIRPRTLDGITLYLGDRSQMQFSFEKARSSAIAADNGSQETGNVIYNSPDQEIEVTTLSGSNILTLSPISLNSVSYTYKPLNDTQGRIEIVGTNPEYQAFVIGDFDDALVDTYWYPFAAESSVPTSDQTLIVNVVFSNSGGSVSNIQNVQYGPSSVDNADFVSSIDESAITVDDLTPISTGRATLTNGGNIPPNYSTVDLTRTLSNSSIEDRTIRFFPSGDTQFNLTFSNASSSASVETGEFGDGVIDNIGTYTYSQIAETDKATLTLTGAPYTGSYTLTYSSREVNSQNAAGNYTKDASSGSFEVVNP